jgi:hypothetical protein
MRLEVEINPGANAMDRLSIIRVLAVLLGLWPAVSIRAQAQVNPLLASDPPPILTVQPQYAPMPWGTMNSADLGNAGESARDAGSQTSSPVTMEDDEPPAPVHPLLQPMATEPAQLRQQVPLTDPTIVDPGTIAPEVNYPSQAILRVYDMLPKRQWSMTYLTGVLFTPYHFGIPIGQQIHMNFLMENVRFGYILRGNDPNRWLRGSSEVIFEIHTMPIIYGPGSIVIGGAVFGRYNFSCNNRKRLMFYLQSGGGGMYSDSYLHPPTSLVGGFNFIIHFGGGFKIFLNRSLSLDFESAYYHYSNGGIVMPNVSINGANEFIGLTYYFGRH